MPKYSADSARSTRYLETDTQTVLHGWMSKPFVGHRHRHERVEQRIVVEYHPDVGLDVRWEARSEDTGKIPEEWALVESFEIREGRCRHDWNATRRGLLR